MTTKPLPVRPAEDTYTESTKYARDLMALRRHAQAVAGYLMEAGVNDWQIKALLHSIVDAGQQDAAGDG